MDIVGAILIAYEITRPFNGEKHEASIGSSPIGGIPTNDPPVETALYQQFDFRRSRYMKYGLGFLVVGFLFQIGSNLLQIKWPT